MENKVLNGVKDEVAKEFKYSSWSDFHTQLNEHELLRVMYEELIEKITILYHKKLKDIEDSETGKMIRNSRGFITWIEPEETPKYAIGCDPYDTEFKEENIKIFPHTTIYSKTNKD